MSDHIVSLAVQKLGDFLHQQVAVVQGVRDDVEWLRTEMQFIQSSLKGLQKKQACEDDDRVRHWISEIINISDEAVDVLLRFKVTAESSHSHGIMSYVRSPTLVWEKYSNLYSISKELESLKNRIRDLSRRRKAYGIIDFSSSSHLSGDQGTAIINGPNVRHHGSRRSPLIRRTTPFMDEEQVTGLEDVTETLKAQLLNEDPCRCVVSIYGMGGLGKTTLARKLYNDTDIGCKFYFRAWVCVSQEYRTQDLLQCIIRSFKGQFLTKEDMDKLEKMTEEDLERYLRDYLEGNRYLVVVDDVWHKEAWESLKRSFPDNKNGGRVIITTRNKEVAVRADDKSFAYALRFLTLEESWSLFCKKVFPGEDREVNSCPPAMRTLAQDMVERCGGLPLAVKVLAGLLAYKSGIDEWIKVKEHIWKQLKKNETVDISRLFTLSYNDLPSENQICFLYLGMFPEDYKFWVEKLIRLWIAEEFIPQGEERMEDVAKEILNELIDRSLIQPVGSLWEKIASCKVHDLLRDLAIERAKEVNLFDIYDPHKHHSSSLSHRRHAIHSNLGNYISLDHPNLKLRTLACFEWCAGDQIDARQFVSRCVEFKLLRVLDLNGLETEADQILDLDAVLKQLIHLKYLGLGRCRIKEIPASIANLRDLQTLVGCIGSCLEMPPEIRELKQLRHLSIGFRGPLEIEALSNLQTLYGVIIDDVSQISSMKSINLRELGVTFDSSFEDGPPLDFKTNLENLCSLKLGAFSGDEYLYLPPLKLSSCKHLLYMQLFGSIKKIPAWQEFPPLLAQLILYSTRLNDDPMPTLERLPNLRSLELSYSAAQVRKMVCTKQGFRQLEYLYVEGLRILEEWEVEEGALPVLKALQLVSCPNLKMVPQRFKTIPGFIRL